MFANLSDALRAGFHILDKHPDGYLVRREIATDSGQRWLVAVVSVSRDRAR